MQRIAVVIVSWNTCALLDRCLATLRDSVAGADFETAIVVVDNGSSDGTVAHLRANHPDVTLLESGRNLGFAGGNNLALRRLLMEQRPPDAMLLLNPDTETVGDAVPQLVRYLRAHPDVAVVGPRLRYPDGSVQSSRRRFPTRATFFWESTPLGQLRPANRWARAYRMDDVPDNAEQRVDWLVGAALLVRRAAIERAGLLDDGFLMYSEELEWQRRIQQHASPPERAIVYLPTAEIIHHEGQSSSQVPAWRLVQFQQSRVRDARMAFGPRFASVLRRFLRVAYTLEAALEGAKWLVNHKRPLRARRFRTYAQVVRALKD